MKQIMTRIWTQHRTANWLFIAALLSSSVLIFIMIQQLLATRALLATSLASELSAVTTEWLAEKRIIVNPNWRLFGQQAAVKSQAGDMTPLTKNLLLHAVFNASVAAHSQVVISTVNTEAKRYRLHDTLPDGGQLVQIDARSVMIAYGPQLERLSMTKHVLTYKPKTINLASLN